MEGWKQCKIEDIVQPLTNVDPKKEPQVEFEYIDVSSVSRLTHKVYETTRLFGAKAPSRARRKVKAGDVLFATIRPTLQRIAIIPDCLDNAVCSTGYYVLRPRDQVLSSFLFYYLFSSSFSNEMECLQRGASYPAVSDQDVKKHSLFLPPLPKQERIVAMLDEAFAAIDTATANTEKNLANAKELFESYLNHVLAEGEEEWELRKLGGVCEVLRGSSPRPIKQFLTNSDDGVNWVKIGDATRSEKYITCTKQKITREGAVRSRKVSPGDLILTNSMSFGKAYVMSIEGYIHDGWFVLRNFKDTFDLDFFFTVLKSKYVLQQINNLAAGSVVKNISGDLVKKVLLPIPPKKEQRLIMSEADKRLDQTKELESIYQAKIKHLLDLKQSLLQKAFTGELTANPKVVDRKLSEASV